MKAPAISEILIGGEFRFSVGAAMGEKRVPEALKVGRRGNLELAFKLFGREFVAADYRERRIF